MYIACKSGGLKKINKGDTIKAKTHPKIGTIAHRSSIEPGNLGRANSREYLEVLDILALAWGRRLMPFAPDLFDSVGPSDVISPPSLLVPQVSYIADVLAREAILVATRITIPLQLMEIDFVENDTCDAMRLRP